MTRTVADQFVDTLAEAGVKRIWGVVGDSLNGVTDALRRHGAIQWLHVRHEEVGAFAAAGEAAVSGEVAVCAGSCGPGNTHLINGLYDAHRSRVPVVAIAAQIPSPEIGSGYFQETHPETLFKECSSYCELISSPAQMPRVLEIALRRAAAERCVCVVVIPGDVALRPAENRPQTPRAALALPAPVVRPSDASLDALAAFLNGAERITLLCGGGCAGGQGRAAGARGRAEVAHGACARRQDGGGARQHLRRRHDRPDRLLLRLPRHARVRRAPDAGDRLPLPAILS